MSCSNPKTKMTSDLKVIQGTVSSTSLNVTGFKKQKDFIDSLSLNTSSLIVLAKIPNTSKLTLVKNGEFPEEVEVSYNLLKDKDGRVIYMFEAPFSESGDWDIAYRPEFD